MTKQKPLTKAEMRAIVKDPNILSEAVALHASRMKPTTTMALTSKWIVTKKVQWEKGFWPAWDIENGWVPLVDKLIEDLLKIGSWDGTLAQCKQKFGGLRFYIGSMRVDKPKGLTKEKAEQSFDLISAAEHKSYTICEKCGGRSTTKLTKSKTGGYRVTNQAEINGWVMALCAKCLKKEEAEITKTRLEQIGNVTIRKSQ